MREVGPESAGGAASKAPPLPPPPPPLCRAPTLSRLSPGAGARGGAGGGAREMGRRARAKQPAPAGVGGAGKVCARWGSPLLRAPPRTCALCKSFDPALLGWRILIGVLLSWSRPTFLQSWDGLCSPGFLWLRRYSLFLNCLAVKLRRAGGQRATESIKTPS